MKILKEKLAGEGSYNIYINQYKKRATAIINGAIIQRKVKTDCFGEYITYNNEKYYLFNEAKVKKLLENTVFSWLDRETIASWFIDGDIITVNTARNGRAVLWALTETQEAAVYIDTGAELAPDEIEKELC